MKEMRYLSLIISILVLFSVCESCMGANSRKYGKKSNDYDYKVRVVGVSDGDTFKGSTIDNQEIKFRIYGIDAPEKRQPFGQKSKQYLSTLIFGKWVNIKIQKKSDRYGRPIVWVFTLDGKDVSSEMLKTGMAWHFKKYDSTSRYAQYEREARNNRLGLWYDKNPVEPWNFRKNKKKALRF